MIRDPLHMGRLKDFEGVPMGMTDIDGLLEYHNRGYLFLELKCDRNTSLNKGQRTAFTRMVDDLSAVKPAVLVVAKHPLGDGRTPILVSTCTVDRYYTRGEWKPGKGLKVSEIVARFISFLDGGNEYATA